MRLLLKHRFITISDSIDTSKFYQLHICHSRRYEWSAKSMNEITHSHESTTQLISRTQLKVNYKEFVSQLAGERSFTILVKPAHALIQTTISHYAQLYRNVSMLLAVADTYSAEVG